MTLMQHRRVLIDGVDSCSWPPPALCGLSHVDGDLWRDIYQLHFVDLGPGTFLRLVSLLGLQSFRIIENVLELLAHLLDALHGVVVPGQSLGFQGSRSFSTRQKGALRWPSFIDFGEVDAWYLNASLRRRLVNEVVLQLLG